MCMHVRDYQATTASIVAELRADDAAAARVGVPRQPVRARVRAVLPAALVPAELGRSGAVAAIRAACANGSRPSPTGSPGARRYSAPIEHELWDAADDRVRSRARRTAFTAFAAAGVARASTSGLATLGV